MINQIKMEIELISDKIKALKKKLRRPNGASLTYNEMSRSMVDLHLAKLEARGLYAIYAWLRGKRFDSVEKFPKSYEAFNAVYYSRTNKVFNQNADVYKIFDKWTRDTAD